jgi:hypothetical protein
VRFWRAVSAAVIAAATCISLTAESSHAATGAPAAFTSAGALGGPACTITGAGDMYCSGLNDFGQLGNNDTTDQSVPTLVVGSHSWAKVITDVDNVCGLTTSGDIYCWGYANLGDNNGWVEVHVPTLVPAAWKWSTFTFTDEGVCAVRSVSGAMYCWGEDYEGELGTGVASTTVDTISPVTGGHAWKAVDSSAYSTCGIKSDDTLWCWGDNSEGALGKITASTANPTQVNAWTWKSVTGGFGTVCGIRSNDAAYCWGSNSRGEGGDGSGDFDQLDTPTLVTNGYSWTSLTAGDGSTCGIRNNGSAYCWGTNVYGQLGNNLATGNTDTPQLVAGSHTWTFISIESGACGIDVSSDLYCWGENFNGSLGDGSTTNRAVPVLIALPLGGPIAESATVSVDVLPSLTFSVGPRASACNGATPTAGTTSGATAVNLGHINPLATAIAAQDLTVSTNAVGGFVVFVRSDGLLRSPSSSITDAPGTNAAPSSFPNVGTAGFGYTTSENQLTSGAADRFTNPGNRWAKLTTSNEPVSVRPAGTPAASDAVCIGYQVGISDAIAAGEYNTSVAYTVIPTF